MIKDLEEAQEQVREMFMQVSDTESKLKLARQETLSWKKQALEAEELLRNLERGTFRRAFTQDESQPALVGT